MALIKTNAGRVEGGCKLLQSNTISMRRAIRENVVNALTGAAYQAKGYAKNEVSRKNHGAADRSRNSDMTKAGAAGLMSDTGALAASIYAFSPKMNEYAKALSEATPLYLSRYDSAHLAKRVEKKVEAPKVTAASGLSHAQSGIASALKYALWWEKGHDNTWTRRHEQQAFMGPAVYDATLWMERRLSGRNLLILHGKRADAARAKKAAKVAEKA